MAAPATRIVSLTITEKGYCHDPATRRARLRAPGRRPRPRRAGRPASRRIGLLVLALDRRRAGAAGPLTVLCCDNLPHNGRLVEGMVSAYARARDPALAAWIAANVAFPSTMVDRIVPATTEADLAEVNRALGLLDGAPVVCEPFRQWVIAGDFAAGRPAWERARRAVRRRRRAVRGDEAAAAQRQPFDARLPRLPGRPRDHLAGGGAAGLHGADARADGRGDADAGAAGGRRPARLQGGAGGALRQPLAAAPDAADRDGRLAETAAAAPRHGSRQPGRGPADRPRGARGRGLDALRGRRRRGGARDQGLRPARRRIRARGGRPPRRPGGARPRLSRPLRRVRQRPAGGSALRRSRHRLARAARRRRRREDGGAGGARPPTDFRRRTNRDDSAGTAPRPPVSGRPRDARPRAPAVRDGEGPADRQPARAHRSAVVRRRRAVRQRVRAVHHARPLRVPDALQPGRPAGGSRHPARRRRTGRNRCAQDLAHVRRALPRVPRHADAGVARPRVPRRVRHPRAADAGIGGPPVRPHQRLPRAAPRSGRARCSSASTSR